MCGVVWCYAGDPAQADKALEPVARARARRSYGVGPMPYPDAAERVRRAVPAGPAVVLARRLRQRAAGRGDRAARRSTARSCRRCSRRCTCTRSTAPCTGSGARTRPSSYRDAKWAEVIVGVDPDPGQRRSHHRLVQGLLGSAAPLFGGRRLRELHDGRGRRSACRPPTATTTRSSPPSRRSTIPATCSGSTRTSSLRVPSIDSASVSHDEPLPMALDSPREAGGPRREARLPPSCQRAPGEVHDSPHRLQPGHRRGRSCRGGHDRSQAGKCPGRKHRRVHHPVRRQQEPRGRTSRPGSAAQHAEVQLQRMVAAGQSADSLQKQPWGRPGESGIQGGSSRSQRPDSRRQRLGVPGGTAAPLRVDSRATLGGPAR